MDVLYFSVCGYVENTSCSHTVGLSCPQPWTQRAYCVHLDLSLPFFWGHKETEERKPQRRKASEGEAVASPALLVMSVTLHMIPHSVQLQDGKHVCRRGTVGKPYIFPCIPASCGCSVWAKSLPTLVGTWQSACVWQGLTSLSPCRLRLNPEDGSGWLMTGEFIPKHCVAAIQSLACFWNKEVPNFKAVGCYSQIPSETLALAADGGVSPEH